MKEQELLEIDAAREKAKRECFEDGRQYQQALVNMTEEYLRNGLADLKDIFRVIEQSYRLARQIEKDNGYETDDAKKALRLMAEGNPRLAPIKDKLQKLLEQ
jgi:disulfide oxidoreductase YuzD